MTPAHSRDRIARQACALTYAGVIPFAALALLFAIGPDIVFMAPEIKGLLRNIFFGYGAIILSFIAGIHWAIYMAHPFPVNLFIVSNLFALVGWSVFFLPDLYAGLALMIGFISAWAVDRSLYKAALHPDWFMTLRTRATVLVVICVGVFVAGRLYFAVNYADTLRCGP